MGDENVSNTLTGDVSNETDLSNGNTPNLSDASNGSDLVTVAVAAERLGVTTSRVMRLLKRDQFTGLTSKRTRQTTTGAREVTVFPASALADLAALIAAPDVAPVGAFGDVSNGDVSDESNLSDANTSDESNTSGDTFAVGDDWRARALVAEAVAAEVRAERDRLAVLLDHERDAHKRAETLHLNTQGELVELRRRALELESVNARLIEALPSPAMAAGDTQAGGTAPEGGNTPERGFWARIFKGKGAA